MTILKIQKRQNPFVQIDREAIQDSSLSWKARGLLAYLLSLPLDWNVRVNDLIGRAPDGRDAVYSILKELKTTGYIVHCRLRDEQGRLSMSEYHVFETPQLSPNPENPEMDKTQDLSILNQDMAFPDLGKPNREKPDAYIINNKQIKQVKNKKTTANSVKNFSTYVHKEVATSTKNKFAAALFGNDLIIHDKLTPIQTECVRAAFVELSSHLSGYSELQAITSIEATLLDPTCFTKTGKIFSHKLNAIKQCIHRGEWAPSANIILAEEKKREDQRNLLHKKIQETCYAIEQADRMLIHLPASTNSELLTHWENEKRRAQQAQQALLVERATLLKTQENQSFLSSSNSFYAEGIPHHD